MDFMAPEDEAIGVEHLLEEPKYHGLVDFVGDVDTFYLHQCINTDKLSTVGYGQRIKTEPDTQISCLIQGERTTNNSLERKFGEANNGLLDGENDLPEMCEDYLLDTEFDESASGYNCIPTKESCIENSGSGHQRSAEVVALSSISSCTPEGKSDDKPSLLDEMTVDELHKSFKAVFGRETSVLDKQWLKHRISTGLQNLNPTETEQKVFFPTELKPTPLTGVFNFKTKPRGKFARRERRAYSDSSRTFSFEESNKVMFCSQNLGEKGSVVVKRRSRRPTQRFINDPVQQNSGHQQKKWGVSKFSKEKNSLIRSCRQQKQLLSVGNELFEGACIQVPFGNPVDKRRNMKEVNVFADCKEKELRQDSKLQPDDMELSIAETADEVSEDDCVTETKLHNNNGKTRRKHHTLWSLPEVIKLVEGVSEYGVGRWTEIKKLLFPTQAHRTSVDLKDKWRNLLRASCMRSRSKRGVGQKRKLGAQPIPQNILRRVRELAVIYPYPRDQRGRIFKNAIASPESVPTSDDSLPLSTDFRV